MPVEDISVPKAKRVTNLDSEALDELQKVAKHINIVRETRDAADELAGTKALTSELERKEGKVEQLEKEKERIEKELQDTRMQVIQKELGGKIDQLAEAIKAGASTKSISEQIAEVKKSAADLGLGASRFSELKDIFTFAQSLSQGKSLVDQVKDLKEAISVLQPEKAKEIEAVGIPASVTLQLKKMDVDLQLELAKMQDERQRRDHDFQVTMKKWEEEREIRLQEIQSRVGVEKDRNEMIGGAIERLGRVFAQATAEGPSEAGISGAPMPVIQAGEGRFGEVDCPVCHSSVPIARDAVRAICPSCHGIYTINRVPSGAPDET